MIKKITIIISSIIIFIITFLIYLNYYGVETAKFNSLIKNEIKSYNNDLNIDLKKVKLLLDLKKFSIKIKTINPTIIYKKNKIEIKKISTIFSLESYFKKNFGINNVLISTKETNINELINISKSIKKSPEIYIISQIIKKGKVEANIDLKFDENGKIKSDYKVKGSAKGIELNIPKNQKINDITFDFSIIDNYINFKNIYFNYNKIKFYSESVLFKNEEDVYFIEGKLKNNEALLDSNILSSIFSNDINYLKFNNAKFISNTTFNLKISKKYKIKDYNLKSKININEIKYNLKSEIINKYLKNYKDNIDLQNNILNIELSKKNLLISGTSNYSINEIKNKFNYKINKAKDIYDFKTNIILDNIELDINELNYKKLKNTKANLLINGKYKKNKSLLLEKVNFIENKNIIKINGLKINLNNDYKISNFKNIKLKYFNENNVNNDIEITYNKNNYKINGKSFDATKLVNDISESDSKSNLLKNFDNFNNIIKLKIDKVYLDKDNFVKNLNGNFEISKNKIIDLNLNSKFTDNEKLYISIKSTNNDEIVTTLYSDRAFPFVKNYKFIKGFEDGVLDFQSIKKNNVSKSILKIDNFKVKEVPALAKLLTLASLQGIADLLTGEGIRFTDFEMVFSNKDNLMTIEELYAIGPAISIMMKGYIESNELISLRGTLVPATTINRTISSIPLIGDILIGKKVGEGVFGVSFKIKGPPKKLKTTVNPIKTLTPRFITRTLEKIKKN